MEIPIGNAVLQRHHDGVGPEQLRHLRRNRFDLMRLHRENDGILRTGRSVVVGRIHARHGQFGSIAVDDPDAAAAQRIQIRTACDEGHLIAGVREPGSQVTANRSDPDDRYLQMTVVHGAHVVALPTC